MVVEFDPVAAVLSAASTSRLLGRPVAAPACFGCCPSVCLLAGVWLWRLCGVRFVLRSCVYVVVWCGVELRLGGFKEEHQRRRRGGGR